MVAFLVTSKGHFHNFCRKVTMAGVRRLLEKDLELEKHALDPHKKFINEHVGMVSKTDYNIMVISL